jgi:hypothetical protein
MKNNKKKDVSVDLKGFEEFIEAQGDDFIANKNQKKETPAENITFLMNETERLRRQKRLFNDQMRMIQIYDQSDELINEARTEIEILRNQIWRISSKENSPFQNSMSSIFDPFFKEG